MAAWSDVHMMFCEGPHDAAFLNRVLKRLLCFKQAQLQLSGLPYPIGNVLQQSFKARAAEDLRLDMAKKFFLPDYVLGHDARLVLIFNYGGSNRARTMPPFLQDVFTLLAATAFSGGRQPPLSYIVFADADVVGVQGAWRGVVDDLKQIGDQVWLGQDWMPIAGFSNAAWQETVQGRVATYVWRQAEADRGTLEDLVLECLSGQEGFADTQAFVDRRFDWTPPPAASDEQVCALSANRLKAAFCVEGQRSKPGGSLGVVLDQAELLTDERLNASVSVDNCVAFLRKWMEVSDVS